MKKGLMIRKTIRKGKGKILHTKRILSNAASDIKAKMRKAPRQMKNYVKHNPYKTAGLTVLAGILLSQLMRLRNLRK